MRMSRPLLRNITPSSTPLRWAAVAELDEAHVTPFSWGPIVELFILSLRLTRTAERDATDINHRVWITSSESIDSNVETHADHSSHRGEAGHSIERMLSHTFASATTSECGGASRSVDSEPTAFTSRDRSENNVF
jgi:hypothetical protein